MHAENRKHKQFVDDHVKQWATDLEKGRSLVIMIAGTVDGGKNYLLKGSNSIPGIIPALQKRMVQLAGESKLSSRISHLRYCDGMRFLIWG